VKVKPTDIILTGYMRLGPNSDQLKVSDRGWFVYPDPGEGLVPVMLIKTTPSP